MSKKTTVKLSKKQLTILPTLYDNLLHLNCSYNMLIELPALPAKLRTLNCSYNKLTAIPPLGHLVTQLLCSDNQLSELPKLMPGTGIDWLDCSDNQLISITDGHYVRNVTYLCCANNKLTELPIELEKSPLCELYCYNNQLTRLPVLPLTLEVLHCQDNQITRLPSIYLTKLDTVDCSHNKLIELPICNNIKTFDASHNQITHIDKLSKNISWSLGHNPIYLEHILQNKHLMEFKDIHSLHLVEKYPFRKRIPVTFAIRQYIESFFWLDGVDKNPPHPSPIIMMSDYLLFIKERHIHILMEWLAEVSVKYTEPFEKLIKTTYMLRRILHVHPTMALNTLQLAGLCAAYYGGILDGFQLQNRVSQMNYICNQAYSLTEIEQYLKKMKKVCKASQYVPQLNIEVWDKDVLTKTQWIEHIHTSIMAMIIVG
jgi:Leucine-rich repeat (LRR) protein